MNTILSIVFWVIIIALFIASLVFVVKVLFYIALILGLIYIIKLLWDKLFNKDVKYQRKR